MLLQLSSDFKPSHKMHINIPKNVKNRNFQMSRDEPIFFTVSILYCIAMYPNWALILSK